MTKNLSYVTIPFNFIHPPTDSPQIPLSIWQTTSSSLISTPTKPNNISKVDTVKEDNLLEFITSAGSIDSTYGDCVKVTFLTFSEVKDVILYPTLHGPDFGNLVCLHPCGTMNPTFIPDIGDLALVPKPLKIFLVWLLKKEDSFPSILRKLWLVTSPTLETHINLCIVHKDLSLECYSYTNFLKVIKVIHSEEKQISLSVYWEPVSNSSYDGRKSICKVNVAENEHSSHELNTATTIMVWNCRDMGRPSFVGHLRHLLRTHMPDIVVLTKTRVSSGLLPCILQYMHLYKITGLSPLHVYGGVAVLSTHNITQFFCTFKEGTTLEGVIVRKQEEVKISEF